MCGIAGFCNGTSNFIKQITGMTEKIRHRGPDSFGYWAESDNSVVFGHRRLAILDVSEAGKQPMISSSGDYVIVFNGEIYNYQDLAERLCGKGISLKSKTDTEIILESFECFGITETLAHLKGMYAIALYDRKSRSLYLIRDRVGEKPLYYGFINGRFTFASDLACFSVIEDFNHEIDDSATELFFRRGYIPAPYSIFKGIKKLEPGHYLILTYPYNEVQDSVYWSSYEKNADCQINSFVGGLDDAANELEVLLKGAIKGQMISDVPLGAFLSAGIDSTTVVSLMQQLSHEPIRTFTVGVDAPGYNEAPIAAEIARRLGTKHTEKYVSIPELKAVIPRLSEIYSEPFADSSQIPTNIISRVARKDVTVALSGDGGDELFCGYQRYNGWVIDAWKKNTRFPACIQKIRAEIMLASGKSPKTSFIKRLRASSLPDLYSAVVGYDTDFVDNVHDYDDYFDLFARRKIGLKTDQDRMMAMDFKMYLPDDILAKVDRAAMFCSLETRLPFLDRDVVEFAWSLPLEYKYKNGITKKVLRNIVYNYVPEKLLNRPKTRFSIPLEQWLLDGELRDWAEELIDYHLIDQTGVLDSKKVLCIWNDYVRRGKWDGRVWNILVFLDWYRKYIKE